MKNKKIIPVILAGGAGKRLWPLSDQHCPKQFLKFNDKLSLFQQALLRVQSIEDAINPIIVSNNVYQSKAVEQIKEINVSYSSFILEPFSRNTAPATALAAFYASNFIDKNILLLIMPSDHIISNSDILLNKLNRISLAAQNEKIVAFGLPPKFCNTQYGYIQIGQKLGNDLFEIHNFKEKPNDALVNQLIKDKKSYWNSGIYLVKASTYLNELKKFSPSIYKHTKKSFDNSNKQTNLISINANDFEKVKNISIDKCIMEKTNIGTIAPSKLDWQDIGSWDRVYQSSQKDIHNNVIKGKVFSQKTKNCLINAHDGLVATIGLNNHIVVKHKENVLVASQNHIEEATQFISSLKNINNIGANFSEPKVFRNWGHYQIFIKQANFQIKQLVITPGKKLSLQLHKHRSEYWVVTKGKAEVICGEKRATLKISDSIHIPKGIKHQIANNIKEFLHIIEIQIGNYLEEDDIVRFNEPDKTTSLI